MGRHWWGVADDLSGAEPLTGRAAEQLAGRLGLRFIPEGKTGTSIMIVGPLAQSDNETLEDVVAQIADAALWWAWPHMVRNHRGRSSVAFHFTHEGEPLELVDPAEHEALRHYVDAYQRAISVAERALLDDEWPWTNKEIRSGHGGKVLLGALAYRTLLPEQVAPPRLSTDVPVFRHVALMRAPRLVVKYLEAPPDPRGLGLSGVFIANPQLDGEFALSEPVAHDDWIPANLGREKYQRNLVKQTLDALRKELRPDFVSGGDVEGGTALSGLLALANGLGALLDGHGIGTDAGRPAESATTDGAGGGVPGGAGFGGGGAESGRDGGGSEAGAGAAGAGSGVPSRTRRASVRLEGRPRLLLLGDQAVARFQVHPSVPAGHIVRVTAEPRVVVDGGAELPSEAPLGTSLPRVLGWSTSADEPATELRDALTADAGTEHAWVWVTQPEDTAVTVLLHVESAS
jgi:hypothetical protein